MCLFKILFVSVLFLLLVNNVFGQRAGYPFHISITGKGKQTMLLIPGFSCSEHVWDETVQNLSADHTCYTITFPGVAGQPAQTDPDLHQWLADVANYISEQHLDRPIVIGHSLGGVLALWLGSEYPELVSRIVVVDAIPCYSAFFDTTFKAKSDPGCNNYGNQFKSMPDQQFLAMQQQGVKRLLADTAMQGTVVNWAMQSDRYTLGNIFCQFLNTDLRGKLNSIKCPTLVLLEPSFKDYDHRMKQQYAGLPSLTIRYASKGLHFVMYDDKEWYMNEVNQFCR